MISNANDIIRNKISRNGPMLSIKNFITLTENEQRDLIKFMLLDYYKLYYSQTFHTPDFLNCDIDEAIEKIIYDPKLIYKFIKATKLFNDLDIANKCILLELMEDFDQDNKLIEISNLHILDKLTYQIVDDIEYYKEYYLDYIQKNNYIKDKREVISEFLANRVIELKEIDFFKYKKYILEFIKVYYKWKLFIKNHDGEYLLNKEDFKYINKIEKLDIDELVKEIEKDYELLYLVVGEYMHYTTSKLEINEEMVDNYLIKATDSKIKQKLKINF